MHLRHKEGRRRASERVPGAGTYRHTSTSQTRPPLLPRSVRRPLRLPPQQVHEVRDADQACQCPRIVVEGEREGEGVTCYGCGKKGHFRKNVPDDTKGDEERDDKGGAKQEQDDESDKLKAGRGKDAGKPEALSGTLYKAIVHPSNATIDAENSANAFYINSGALDHLIPCRTDLNAYRKLEKLVGICTTNSGTVYASR